MWISDISIKRPVFAIMLIAALVGLGALSYGRLGVDLFPRVEFPYVSIQTSLTGASPDAIETEISDPIEEEVNTISGIENLTSVNMEGLSAVMIEFGLDEDANVKAQDVRDKVAIAVGELPADADAPVVQKMDPDADPIMSVIVSGDRTIRELTTFADKQLKERIQRIPGVGSVTLLGGQEREIRIWLDANKLRSQGITAGDVLRSISNEHAEIPGGRMETAGNTAEYTVKTKGEVKSVAEFRNLVVAFKNGLPTRLGDVARVEDGVEDIRTYAELDGQPGIALEIRRQSGKNTAEVARTVKNALNEIKQSAPEGTRIIVTRDVSRFIESSADDVTKDMQLGIVLVVIVTLAFLLSFRATVIVALAMPTALISTFFAFYVMGFTLNMLTLMALSVSIGLLVDDAIVVLESIHRHVEEGYPPMEAASKGVKRVGLAVFAGSASVIAVFAPIAFLDGMVGRFFFEYGLAIVFAVLVSLLVSITLTPMLCSRFLRKNVEGSFLANLMDRGYGSLERGYRWLLGQCFKARWLVVLLALGAIYGGIQVAGKIPSSFDSKTDRSEFLMSFQLPSGTGISESTNIGRTVAQQLKSIPAIKTVLLTIGGEGRASGVNKVRFYVELTPKAERPLTRTQFHIMDEVRALIPTIAPTIAKLNVFPVPWVGGGGSDFSKNVVYQLTGPSLAQLEVYADTITDEMRNHGELFTDISHNFETGKPEVQVQIDRNRAADLGVSVRELASTIRTMVGGSKAGTYEEDGSRYDIRVRLEDEMRNDVSKLSLIQVRRVDGGLVDLPNIARIEVGSGPVEINRANRTRAITVSANTPAGAAQGDSIKQFETIVERLNLPPEYQITQHGEAKRMKEAQVAIATAFVLALVTLYMILASQFNSFAQPAIIMMTAPLSFVGAFILLYLTMTPLSIFAQIGFIALMGLVMKNGILLVDYANQLREDDGMTAKDAMLLAAPVRLRPILMTAFSTIFGMIPVAISVSDGSEMRQPMGMLVIGGMTSSTFLTLLVVPVVFTLFADAGTLIQTLYGWIIGLFGGKKTPPQAAE